MCVSTISTHTHTQSTATHKQHQVEETLRALHRVFQKAMGILVEVEE